MAKIIANLKSGDGGYICDSNNGCLIEGVMTAGTISFGADGSITPGDSVLSVAVTVGPTAIAIPKGYAAISSATADLFVSIDDTPYGTTHLLK